MLQLNDQYHKLHSTFLVPGSCTAGNNLGNAKEGTCQHQVIHIWASLWIVYQPYILECKPHAQFQFEASCVTLAQMSTTGICWCGAFVLTCLPRSSCLMKANFIASCLKVGNYLKLSSHMVVQWLMLFPNIVFACSSFPHTNVVCTYCISLTLRQWIMASLAKQCLSCFVCLLCKPQFAINSTFRIKPSYMIAARFARFICAISSLMPYLGISRISI